MSSQIGLLRCHWWCAPDIRAIWRADRESRNILECCSTIRRCISDLSCWTDGDQPCQLKEYSDWMQMKRQANWPTEKKQRSALARQRYLISAVAHRFIKVGLDSIYWWSGDRGNGTARHVAWSHLCYARSSAETIGFVSRPSKRHPSSHRLGKAYRDLTCRERFSNEWNPHRQPENNLEKETTFCSTPHPVWWFQPEKGY